MVARSFGLSLCALLGLFVLAGCERQVPAGDPSQVPVARAATGDEDAESDEPPPGFEPGVAGIVLTPPSIHFGAIGHGVKQSTQFTIENRGKVPQEITKVSASCGCMTANCALGVLAPGQKRTCTIDVSFGEGHSKFDKYVRVYMGGFEQSVVFHVRADWHPTLKPPPPEQRRLELVGLVGRESPEGQKTYKFERKAHDEAPLSVENPQIVGQRQSEGKLSLWVSREEHDLFELTIKVAPEHPPGPILGKVTATVEGLPYTFSVGGSVYRGIRTKPDNFQFGLIKDVAAATCTVELLATDGQAFKIESIDVVPPVVTIEQKPHPTQPGYVLTAKLTQPYPKCEKNRAIVEKGPGKILLHTSHPDAKEITLKFMGVIQKNMDTAQQGKK